MEDAFDILSFTLQEPYEIEFPSCGTTASACNGAYPYTAGDGGQPAFPFDVVIWTNPANLDTNQEGQVVLTFPLQNGNDVVITYNCAPI